MEPKRRKEKALLKERVKTSSAFYAVLLKIDSDGFIGAEVLLELRR